MLYIFFSHTIQYLMDLYKKIQLFKVRTWVFHIHADLPSRMDAASNSNLVKT